MYVCEWQFCSGYSLFLINIGGTSAVYLFKKDKVSWGGAI